MSGLDAESAISVAVSMADCYGEAHAIVRDGPSLAVVPILDAIGRDIMEVVRT